jgi:organic hydroperoxide reductase OsmC/OhrA
MNLTRRNFVKTTSIALAFSCGVIGENRTMGKATADNDTAGARRDFFPGFDAQMIQKAEDLVESAHKICPYSNAIRGNVDVGITVSVR